MLNSGFGIMLLAFSNNSRSPLKAGLHLLLRSRAVAAGAGAPKTPSSSPLLGSFLDEIQQNFENLSRGFSSMSNDGDSSPTDGDTKYYTVGITGSGGLVGTALRDELGKRGALNGRPVRIVRLSRGEAAERRELDDTTETSLVWNPKGPSADEVMDPKAAATMDAIVHLSGENVATGMGSLGFLGLRPWTAAKKAEILNSRVGPTKAMAQVVASSSRPQTFLVASGIGAYGDDFIGDEARVADESSDISNSSGFLAEVSRQWEASVNEARTDKKNRVVNMRFGVVLSKQGGALAKLYPIFLLGGGGNVGSGRQYFSFISARDHARAIVHTLETPSLDGPVNFCTPNSCTNAEFTKALGKVLSRPTVLPLPSIAVNALFGEMGREMLLGGCRVNPAKLLESGFQFQHPTIEEALSSAMEETI